MMFIRNSRCRLLLCAVVTLLTVFTVGGHQAHAVSLGDTSPWHTNSTPDGVFVHYMKIYDNGVSSAMNVALYYPATTTNWAGLFATIAPGSGIVCSSFGGGMSAAQQQQFMNVTLSADGVASKSYSISLAKACTQDTGAANVPSVSAGNDFYANYPLPDQPGLDTATGMYKVTMRITYNAAAKVPGANDPAQLRRLLVQTNGGGAYVGPLGNDQRDFPIIGDTNYASNEPISLSVPFGRVCNSGGAGGQKVVLYDADNGGKFIDPTGTGYYTPTYRVWYRVVDAETGVGVPMNNIKNGTLKTSSTGKQWIQPTDGSGIESSVDVDMQGNHRYSMQIINVHPRNYVDVGFPNGSDGIFGVINCNTPGPTPTPGPGILTPHINMGTNLLEGDSTTVSPSISNDSTTDPGVASSAIRDAWYWPSDRSCSGAGCSTTHAGVPTITTVGPAGPTESLGGDTSITQGDTHPLGTYPVNDLQSGWLCASLTLSTNDPNTNLNGNPLVVCQYVTPAQRPYFEVTGGDIVAGAGVEPGCGVSATDGEVKAFNSGSAGGYKGSATDRAIFALKNIVGVASGTFAEDGTNRTNLPGTQPNGLAFANTGSPSTPGNFGALGCSINYANDVSNGLTPEPPVVDVPLDGMMSGAHVYDLPTGYDHFTLHGTVANGVSISLVFHGKVVISGDITNVAYTGVANAPKLSIISTNDIVVAGNVGTITGFYSAQDGTIATCADGGGTETISPSICGIPLTINGALLAKDIRFDRTSGSQTTTPAEKVIFSPELWAARLNDCTASCAATYDSITSLAPVL